MAEITSEMIDNIIEAEKKHKKAVEKQFNRIMRCFVAPLLFIEIIVILGLLVFSITKMFAAAVISVVIDILFFLIVIEILTFQETKMFALVSIFKTRKRKRFDALVDAAPTVEEKLRLYCENIKRSRTASDKLPAIEEYLKFISVMCIEQDIDWVYDELSKIKSDKFIAKASRLNGLISYFSIKDDNDGFIRTLEENQELIRQIWNYALFSKLDILVWCCEYYALKEEYQKQLEYYDLMIEFRKKAAEIDINYALTYEMYGEIKIDYARIFCKLGRFEEAKKCLREAEEILRNTDMPYIKNFMEEARKMLEEADTNYSEGK